MTPSSKSAFEDAFLSNPICHRALHNRAQGIIENSAEAVDAALKAGLPIEIDLQNTKDARAVVFHDERLKRLTGVEGFVRSKSLAQMQSLPLLGGGRTLAFSELLERVNGAIPVLVEVKDQDGRLGPNLGSFLPDIIALVKAYDGPLALMSFSPYLCAALREALPKAWIGLTTDAFSLFEWPSVPYGRLYRLRRRIEVPGLRYDFISHDWHDLARVESFAKPKLSWTIKSAADEKTARKGADNITFEGYMPVK